MPPDATPAAARARLVVAASSFVPCQPPPRLAIWSEEDKAALSALEGRWAGSSNVTAPNRSKASEPQDDGTDNTTRAPDTPLRLGLPVSDAARELNIPRQAFVALCDAHGILELRPYGGVQNRRLISTAAMRARLGWNVRPRGLRARGRAMSARCSPFAVFNPERLQDLAWQLDWQGIVRATAALTSRDDRRSFLLTKHAYLPDVVIGDLSGYARTAVQKARAATLRRDGGRSG